MKKATTRITQNLASPRFTEAVLALKIRKIGEMHWLYFNSLLEY